MKNINKIVACIMIVLNIFNVCKGTLNANNGLMLKYDGEVHNYLGRTVKIQYNGKEVKTGEMPGVILNNRTLVPAREVFESMGAKVDWNNNKKEAYVTFQDIYIKMVINSKTAYVRKNGVMKEVTLDVPAKLIQDMSKSNPKTMIPIRFVSESIGYTVDWDSKNYIVLITSKIDIVNVTGIEHKQSNDKNQFIIEADGEIKCYNNSTWDNKLILNVENSINKMQPKYSYSNQNYSVSEIRTSQFSKQPMTTRVVFDLISAKTSCEINLTNDKKGIIIEFNNTINDNIDNNSINTNIDNNNQTQTIHNNLENIKYVMEENPKIIIKKPEGVTINNIITTDLYMKKQFTIELPGNLLRLYETDKFEIGNEYLEKIELTLNKQGNTVFNICSNKVFAYKIIEDSKNFIINILKPSDVYSKIVVVDAGHGGQDPGAIGNHLKEKDVNLDMVNFLKDLLDNNKEIKTYYTRLDDSYPTLSERCDLANDVGADIFLSVHNNAYTSDLNGTESLYYNTPDDGNLTSYKFAKILQEELISKLQLKDRGLKERNELFVLKNSEMPAVIVEVGFITSPIDSNYLKDENFKIKTGEALYTAIIRIFDEYK